VDLGVAVGELARIADVRVHRLIGHWVTVGEPRRFFDPGRQTFAEDVRVSFIAPYGVALDLEKPDASVRAETIERVVSAREN
jgi:hypothetical protein